MKHKEDAIKEAKSVISLHSRNIRDEKIAIRAALITCEYARSTHDSLNQRTINYLLELAYGPEIAELIRENESKLRSLYHSFVKTPDQYDEITNQISSLKNHIETLKQ